MDRGRSLVSSCSRNRLRRNTTRRVYTLAAAWGKLAQVFVGKRVASVTAYRSHSSASLYVVVLLNSAALNEPGVSPTCKRSSPGLTGSAPDLDKASLQAGHAFFV